MHDEYKDMLIVIIVFFAIALAITVTIGLNLKPNLSQVQTIISSHITN